MLIYRKDKTVPLSADEVDNNFRFLYIYNNISYYLDVESAKVITSNFVGDFDFVASGVHNISNPSDSVSDYICFKLKAGDYFRLQNFTIGGVNLLDFDGCLLYDGLAPNAPNSHNAPNPQILVDCFLVLTLIPNCNFNLHYSTSPIVIQ